MAISDPRHTECPSLTERRWEQCALPVIITMALWQQMHLGTWCMVHNVNHVPKGKSCHKAIVVITGKARCFHDNIYEYIYKSLIIQLQQRWSKEDANMVFPLINNGKFIMVKVFIVQLKAKSYKILLSITT